MATARPHECRATSNSLIARKRDEIFPSGWLMVSSAANPDPNSSRCSVAVWAYDAAGSSCTVGQDHARRMRVTTVSWSWSGPNDEDRFVIRNVNHEDHGVPGPEFASRSHGLGHFVPMVMRDRLHGLRLTDRAIDNVV